MEYVSGYRIYRGSTSGSETLLAIVGNVLSYTDTAVANGGRYFYQVSAAAALAGVDGLRALHDRRVRDTPRNIDHIVVAAAGVFVVDWDQSTAPMVRGARPARPRCRRRDGRPPRRS